MSMGRVLKALNGKQMTVGYKREKKLRVVSSRFSMEKNILYFINEKNESRS